MSAIFKTPFKQFRNLTFDTWFSIRFLCSGSHTVHKEDASKPKFTKVDIHVLEFEDKVKLVYRELEFNRNLGREVPTSLSDKEIAELINLPSISSRRKYFRYLWSKEKRVNYERRRKELRRLEKESSVYEKKILNTVCPVVYSSSWKLLHSYRLMYAVMFGQSLVIDFSYDDFMTERECKNAAYQISEIYGINRLNLDPFHLSFCNMKKDQRTTKYLSSKLPRWIVTVTDRSYSDIFSKNELIYLSPDAEEVLEEFDHDAVYVVGAFVDLGHKKFLSSEKANQEGLRMMKLPLDKYLKWKAGKRSLTLDQVLKILLELKISGCWQRALKNVPKRKYTELIVEEVS